MSGHKLLILRAASTALTAGTAVVGYSLGTVTKARPLSDLQKMGELLGSLLRLSFRSSQQFLSRFDLTMQ